MDVHKGTVVVVKSSGFGIGEMDLGDKLIKSFFGMLVETGRVPGRMIFINSGIFLTTTGSPVLGLLREIAEKGTQLLSCSTCLDYYDRREELQAGDATNMRDTVRTLFEFEKVISI